MRLDATITAATCYRMLLVRAVETHLLIAKFHYTDTDTDFFAAKLRWVRAGPFGSMSVSV